MPSRIVELFGYGPQDRSAVASHGRRKLQCPFLGKQCVKTLNDGTISGVCTLKLVNSGPVICCPIRLYAGNYEILNNVAQAAFGQDVELHPSGQIRRKISRGEVKGIPVAVFGKRWGGELRLPKRGGRGGYFVDWILARLNKDGSLAEFAAVEVQSIDTTGNYRAERNAHMRGATPTMSSTAGLNWENVSKRILPQIIYKGHVLRREPLCQRGLFFVCPEPVYERLRQRLGGDLLAYQLQPGALTFRWYDLGNAVPDGHIRPLSHRGQFTTTIDQVALAFTAPANLPPPRVYEQAIREELGAPRLSADEMLNDLMKK